MTRKVREGDDVFRVAPAPDWRPAPAGALKTMRREAAALSSAAIQDHDPGLAARALSMRAQLRLVETVRGYVPPVLDPGGALPWGPARGALDHATIVEVETDPHSGAPKIVDRQVRKRRGPSALSGFEPQLRRIAEAYADLTAAVASVAGSWLSGPGGGGISDGGATARCALAKRLTAARVAIGDAVVLSPRGAAAQRDHARTALTVRALVDRICLQGWTIDHVLASHGWSRRQAYRAACQQAMRAALQRLAEVR